MKKFYRHTVTFSFLSEDTFTPDVANSECSGTTGLARVIERCDRDDLVAEKCDVTSEELTEKQVADALYAAGSEPGFFQIDQDE